MNLNQVNIKLFMIAKKLGNGIRKQDYNYKRCHLKCIINIYIKILVEISSKIFYIFIKKINQLNGK